MLKREVTAKLLFDASRTAGIRTGEASTTSVPPQMTSAIKNARISVQRRAQASNAPS